MEVTPKQLAVAAKVEAEKQTQLELEFWTEKAGQARWQQEHNMLDTPAPKPAIPDLSDYDSAKPLVYFESKAEAVKATIDQPGAKEVGELSLNQLELTDV